MCQSIFPHPKMIEVTLCGKEGEFKNLTTVFISICGGTTLISMYNYIFVHVKLVGCEVDVY